MGVAIVSGATTAPEYLPVDIRPKMAVRLSRMPTQRNADDREGLLQGTLDLLILKTLALGSQHGQGVARLIQRQSDEVFAVDHGASRRRSW
jgi:hypothetical protein